MGLLGVLQKIAYGVSCGTKTLKEDYENVMRVIGVKEDAGAARNQRCKRCADRS